MDNWLAKLASEQPTTAENLEQALGELSLPELQELAQEQAATPNLDNLQQKVAEADQMGRELAQQHGPGLAAQAEQRAVQNHAVMQSVQDLPEDEAIKLAFILEHGTEQEKQAGLASLAAKGLGAVKNMAGKAISSNAGQKAIHMGARNPRAAAAVAGGAAGGVHSKATGGSFLGGAALGAGMGAGAAHLAGPGKVTGMLGKASKWGKGQVKTAGLGKAMVSKLKSKGVPKLNVGRAALEGAKRPAAIGGALGGVSGAVKKPEEGQSRLGNVVRGAAKGVIGGGIGAGGMALAAKALNKNRAARAQFRQATKGPFSKMWKNASAPLTGAVGAMVAHDLSKLAYLDDNKNEWLEQFEGTPLLEQAVGMVQEELQKEIDSIEERQQEDEHRRQMDTGSSSHHERDMLRAKKKMLELQLVAQRNGMGDPTGGGAEAGGEPAPEAPPEGGEEMPTEAAPEPGTPPMEEAQEQVKEAYAAALQKTAYIGPDQVAGYFIGKKKGREQAERGEAHDFGGKQIASLLVPGGVGYQLGRAGGHASASKEKQAAMPRIRMARDVRRAAARAAAKGAEGAKAAKGAVKETAKSAKGVSKKKLLLGAGAVGASAGAGAAVGHKKGKTKGRREGFGVGVRRGYTAGARRGYMIGRSYSKTASFS